MKTSRKTRPGKDEAEEKRDGEPQKNVGEGGKNTFSYFIPRKLFLEIKNKRLLKKLYDFF